MERPDERENLQSPIRTTLDVPPAVVTRAIGLAGE
jgi:hypothetical protein